MGGRQLRNNNTYAQFICDGLAVSSSELNTLPQPARLQTMVPQKKSLGGRSIVVRESSKARSPRGVSLAAVLPAFFVKRAIRAGLVFSLVFPASFGTADGDLLLFLLVGEAAAEEEEFDFFSGDLARVAGEPEGEAAPPPGFLVFLPALGLRFGMLDFVGEEALLLLLLVVGLPFESRSSLISVV